MRSNNRLLAFFYVALALPSVVLLCFLTPPFAGSDEAAHYFRIAGLARGQILPIRGQDGKVASAGGMLDGSMNVIREKSLFPDAIPQNFRMTDGSIDEIFKIPKTGRDAYTAYSNTAIYPPPIYAPSVIVAWITDALDLPLMTTFYIERLLGGLLGIVVIALCIAHCRVAAIPFLIAGLTPLALYQLCTISSELTVIPLFFVFSTLLVRIFTEPSQGRFERNALAITLFIIGPGKIAYLPLIILPAIAAWLRDRALSPRVILFVGAAIAAVIAWFVWAMIIQDMIFSLREGIPVDPKAQLVYIMTHFADFIVMFGKAIVTQAPTRIFEMFGMTLGHGIFYTSRYFLLTGLSLFVLSSVIGTRITTAQLQLFLVALALAIFCFLVVYLLIYLQYNAVGDPALIGVQGRYFLPLAIMLCALAPKPNARPGIAGLVFTLSILWCVISPLLTIHSIYQKVW